MSASDPTARKRLPVNPSAEHLRKQAKRRARVESIPLARAQHELAREYGAKHWAELMHVVETMHSRSASKDFEALPAAANAGDLARVRELLAAGDFTQHGLDLALARAVIRFADRAPIARLLVDHGADPDGQYGAEYGPIVFATGEALDVDGLQFLIDAGCDVTAPPIATKYGVQCVLSAWLGSYLRGRNDAKRRGVDLLVARGAYVPPDVTPIVLGLHRDDAAGLGHAVGADPALIVRTWDALPYVELPGATLLHYAAELGASACLRELLDRGANPNARTPAGIVPIISAARGGSVDDVRLLLDRGAHGWITDNAGMSAADHARASVANPHRDAVARLLSEIVFDDDAFRRAVELVDRGDVNALRELLRTEPRLATSRVLGDSALTRGYFNRPTLLHFVAQNPNRHEHMPPRVLDSTRAILDAGADVNASTDHVNGGTTLALVASSGPAHADQLVRPLIDLLVERGADPSDGLRAAMLHGYADTVRHLHALGAKPTAISAAGLGDLAALEALIDAGMSVADRVDAGWAAAMNGQGAAIDRLVDAGLDPNVRLPRPFAPTMLHEAASRGERAACERLVARGADRTIRDTQYDATPADWAEHAGHVELAAFLAAK
jgi:peptide-methionine (S)-S-oxide reductase